MKKAFPILLSFTFLVGVLLWIFVLRTPPDPAVLPRPSEVTTAPNVPIPPLVQPPRGFVADWDSLNAYQETISASELRNLLETVYTVDDTWKQVIKIEEATATIQTAGEPFLLRLRRPDLPAPTSVKRYWRSDVPLQDLHIAIDPGHIGGDFAGIEERQFGLPKDKLVREGEITLQTAIRLKPLLEAMGARVSLVRESNTPVTKKRSADFLTLYRKYNPQWPDALLQPYANGRFYRRDEIVERARIVNEGLKPDLVLCLHYNASSGSGDWSTPGAPVFVEENHFHLLLNGAYTVDEVLDEGDRFEMLERILQRTHEREAALGEVAAKVFLKRTALTPYSYDPKSKRARNVNDQPALWARNLLANRSYLCPVLFFEPYVMNNADVYARIQAGDYEGEKLVNGVLRPSIMREYAEAVAAGIAEFYSTGAAN